MAGTWADAVKVAMKILGPQGKIPDFPKTIYSTGNSLGKSWSEFEEARKSLKEKYDEHLRNWDKYQGARLAFIDDLGRDNLGLDPKNKEENRKIAEARKPLLERLNKWNKEHETQVNKLKSLNSDVTSIINYVEPD